MGNYLTKVLSHVDENIKEDEIQSTVQQTATKDDNTCTPLSDKKMLNDPRSATLGIPRTPIEVNYTPVESKRTLNAIPKYLQRRRQYLETDIDVVMPPLTPKKQLPTLTNQSPELNEIRKTDLKSNINVVESSKVITPIDKERYKILGLDPRSPAADFDRTPILIPRSLALIKTRFQENMTRRGSYESDIYNSRNSYQEITTSSNASEIRLLPDIASEGLKALNSKAQKEIDISGVSLPDSDTSVSENDEQITVIKNPQFKDRVDKSFILDKHISVNDKKEVDIEYNMENMKTVCIGNDDTIKIWHDSLEDSISDKMKKKENIENQLSGEISREDVIITFDKDVTKNTSSVKTVINIQEKENTGDKRKKNCEIDTNSNEQNVFTPDKKHEKAISKNRTPLSNRSNNGQTQGMLAQSPKLLKYKTVTAKIPQENMLSHKTCVAKNRNGTQWDLNSTVII